MAYKGLSHQSQDLAQALEIHLTFLWLPERANMVALRLLQTKRMSTKNVICQLMVRSIAKRNNTYTYCVSIGIMTEGIHDVITNYSIKYLYNSINIEKYF